MTDIINNDITFQAQTSHAGMETGLQKVWLILAGIYRQHEWEGYI